MYRAARRRVAVVAAVLVSIFVACVVQPGAAFAHDKLVTSSPANESTVTALPGVVVLDLEEPPVAGYTRVHVYAPSGADLSRGAPVTTGSKITLAIKPSREPGVYMISWSLLSDDGHPVAGDIHFTLAATSKAAPTASVSLSAVAATHKAKKSTLSSVVAVVLAGIALLAIFAMPKALTSARRRRGTGSAGA